MPPIQPTAGHVSSGSPTPATPPIAPPQTTETSTPITETSTPATSTPAALDGVDGTHAANATAIISGPNVAGVSTMPGILEAFPVSKLEKIEGKGIQGQTFMLDSGSLRGLKLQVRRVKDGDQSGFDIVFQLLPTKVPTLIESLKKKGAKQQGLSFRGAEVGQDGIAKLTSVSGSITSSGTHAPSDQDTNSGQWVTALSGSKGGSLEVVNDKAALAMRGFVRISLRGDDKACSAQLQELIKTTGIGQVFAPPTPKSKRINMLMRALWQADNATAEKLAAGDIDKLKVEDLEKALGDLGWSKERINGLRYEEVYGGHFTTVDPMQAEEMARNGARYLYSTVTEPAHVLSILQNGQKASVSRYKDGLIINGMSTNADFSSGGGTGVFTRLVTQEAIYGGQSWTGRTYKLIQNYEQLGRTDWYGWNSDYYGRRWGLDSKVNFGLPLLKSIDNGGYKSSCELIFTAGNRPENIDRVVATTPEARTTLIEFLKKEGYKPHNGLSIEDFVVLAPKFMVFGPSPYDASDPAKFAKEALEKAKAGETAPLQWFLIEGPSDGGVRAKLESDVILSGDATMHGYILKAAKLAGKFSMSTEQMQDALTKLQAKEDAPSKQLVTNLVSGGGAEALFRSNSDAAAELLAKSKPAQNSGGYYSYSQPYSLDDDTWVRIYRDLAAKQTSDTKSKSFELALEVRAQTLLKNQHAGFIAFLKEFPLVKPADPKAFVDAEMNKLSQNGDATQLALYIAQISNPKELAYLQKKLIEADKPATLELLKPTLAKTHEIDIDGATLKGILEKLPHNSQTRQHLLTQEADTLLKTGDAGLLAMLSAQNPNQKDFNLYDQARWLSVIKKLTDDADGAMTPMLREVMERAANKLASNKEFVAKLKNLELYDVSDSAAFVSQALKEVQNGNPGYLKLTWLFFGPDEKTQPHRLVAAEAILRSNDYSARQVLDQARAADPNGRLPFTDAELGQLVKKLDDDQNKQPLQTLYGMSARQIIAGATNDLLPIFDKTCGTQGLSSMSIYAGTAQVLLQEIDKRTDADAKEVKTWVLNQTSKYSVSNNEQAFIDYLKTNKLSLSDIGQDAAWAATIIHSQVQSQSYYWTSSYYANQDYYKNIPAGAKWCLESNGGGGYNEAVLNELCTQLPKWKWQKPLFDAFLSKLEGLPDEWKTKLAAAQAS